MTRAEAARICDVNESCPYDWQQRFPSGGIEGMETKKAPGPERRLTAEELGRRAALMQSGLEAAGFDTGVWTTRQVKKMIKREFGQSYCTSQICRILHALGFSFHLPKTRLARADAEAQREWREERMSSFHFQFSEKLNAHTFLKFLERLIRHEARKVLLVLDNVGYHHARLVTVWAGANAHKIELHFLPAYSPDLNPIEIPWRQTKRSATHNRHFDTRESLHHRLFRRFNRHQGNPAFLRGIVGTRAA